MLYFCNILKIHVNAITNGNIEIWCSKGFEESHAKFYLKDVHAALCSIDRSISSQHLTITDEIEVFEGQLVKGAVPIRRKEKLENIP